MLRRMAAFSSIPTCLPSSVISVRIRSNCRAATPRRISTATHESPLAVDCLGASRGVSRSESSHGLAVCVGSWLTGKASLGGRPRSRSDCSRTRRRDHAGDSRFALRSAFPPGEYSEMGSGVISFRARSLSTLPRESSPGCRYESRREGSVRLVLPHGVCSWCGTDAPASSDGTTDVRDDAQHGGRNGCNAFFIECVRHCICSVAAHCEHVG